MGRARDITVGLEKRPPASNPRVLYYKIFVSIANFKRDPTWLIYWMPPRYSHEICRAGDRGSRSKWASHNSGLSRKSRCLAFVAMAGILPLQDYGDDRTR